MKKTGLKRDNSTLDKFYTKPSVATSCCEHFKKTIGVRNVDLIVEPSAGNGAFINPIRSLFPNLNHKFIDIEPEDNEIEKMNYLESTFSRKEREKIHIIGNPPFGRQSTLAIQFIKKSAEFADTIAFILPKSFKKESMKKYFPLKFHLVSEIELENDGFLVDGEVYNVPCVFQIWERREKNRAVIAKLKPLHYSFVKANALPKPDFAFRRVGVYAGTIYMDIEDKSEQSHYFIRVDEDRKFNDKLFEKISNLNYPSRENTVGPKSISKQELIQVLNPVFLD